MLLLMAVHATITAATTDVNLHLRGDDKIEILLKGATADIITIQMYNGDGRMVFAETVAPANRAVVNHDVKNLPAGLYTYTVVEGAELIYSAQIIICQGGKSVCGSLTESAVAAILLPDNDHVLVRIQQPEACKTTIRLKDRQGNVLYSRKITEKGNHKFSHDISQLPAVNYRMEVLDGHHMIAQRKIAHQ